MVIVGMSVFDVAVPVLKNGIIGIETSTKPLSNIDAYGNSKREYLNLAKTLRVT